VAVMQASHLAKRG